MKIALFFLVLSASFLSHAASSPDTFNPDDYYAPYTNADDFTWKLRKAKYLSRENYNIIYNGERVFCLENTQSAWNEFRECLRTMRESGAALYRKKTSKKGESWYTEQTFRENFFTRKQARSLKRGTNAIRVGTRAAYNPASFTCKKSHTFCSKIFLIIHGEKENFVSEKDYNSFLKIKHEAKSLGFFLFVDAKGKKIKAEICPIKINWEGEEKEPQIIPTVEAEVVSVKQED